MATDTYQNYLQKATNAIPQKDSAYNILDAQDRRNMGNRIGGNWANASTAWYAATPTFITPQFEDNLRSTASNTLQAQIDNNMRNINQRYASTGMFGQGANQAAARGSAQASASEMAKLQSGITQNIEQQRYNDFVNWYNAAMGRQQMIDNYSLGKQSLEMQRAQMANQNNLMADAQRRSSRNSWITGGINLGAGLLGAGLSGGLLGGAGGAAAAGAAQPTYAGYSGFGMV